MANKTVKTPVGSLNSIDKILSVIDWIFTNESTFNDIQKKLDLPKSTLHRILHSLEKYELVEKDGLTDCYKLGLKFIYYGEGIKAKLSLPKIVKPSLLLLTKKIGETACLSVLYQGMSLTLSSYRGEASALVSNLVPFSPLNCCASGKIFLSSLPDEELKAYFDSGKPLKKTDKSIMTYNGFEKEREQIRKTGLAYDNEEYEYGLYCISVPLYSHNGQIDASLGITAPKARLFMQDVSKVEKLILDASCTISGKLTKMKYDFEF